MKTPILIERTIDITRLLEGQKLRQGIPLRFRRLKIALRLLFHGKTKPLTI